MKKREDMVGGLILIGIGILFLVGRLINVGNFGLLILPALGAVFAIAGILKRDGGLMVPGGILSGIGLGVYLTAVPFEFTSGIDTGGLFLLSLAAGFVSVTVMSAIFARETHWWALIPGGIIGLVGTAVLFGGAFMSALELLGTYWPVILILVGILVLFQAGRERISKEEKFN